MEPDKLPPGSQALDWHLTDESLFTHATEVHVDGHMGEDWC